MIPITAVCATILSVNINVEAATKVPITEAPMNIDPSIPPKRIPGMTINIVIRTPVLRPPSKSPFA